jgi:hypothetical protein
MTKPDKLADIGIGFPVDSAERARIERLLTAPLPPEAAGSVYQKCADDRCTTVIAVGPKLQASQLPVYCPWCGLKLAHSSGRPLDIYPLEDPYGK